MYINPQDTPTKCQQVLNLHTAASHASPQLTWAQNVMHKQYARCFWAAVFHGEELRRGKRLLNGSGHGQEYVARQDTHVNASPLLIE